MIKEPKVSVVIPSYNKDKFIGITLESILQQNYDNYEVIVQDGGSTDKTIDIIKSYKSKFRGKLKWLSKKDKGQLDAINKGLKKASGDILTFINADDVYEVGAFRKVGNNFKKNTLWLAGKGKVINGKGIEVAKATTQYKNVLLKINNYNLLLVVNYLIQPSVFLSKTAYEKYGPFTGTDKFVMEYDFWLKLAKIEMPYVIDDYLSSFRMSGDNISSTDFKSTLLEDEEIVKKHTSNTMILGLHKLHNMGRVGVVKFINN